MMYNPAVRTFVKGLQAACPGCAPLSSCAVSENAVPCGVPVAVVFRFLVYPGLSPGSAVAAFRVVAAAGLAAGKSCQDWLRFDCRDVPELAAARSRVAVPFAGSNG